VVHRLAPGGVLRPSLLRSAVVIVRALYMQLSRNGKCGSLTFPGLQKSGLCTDKSSALLAFAGRANIPVHRRAGKRCLSYAASLQEAQENVPCTPETAHHRFGAPKGDGHAFLRSLVSLSGPFQEPSLAMPVRRGSTSVSLMSEGENVCSSVGTQPVCLSSLEAATGQLHAAKRRPMQRGGGPLARSHTACLKVGRYVHWRAQRQAASAVRLYNVHSLMQCSCGGPKMLWLRR
jgi:hypothetical protein